MAKSDTLPKVPATDSAAAAPADTKQSVQVLAPRNDIERPANTSKAGAKSKYDFASLEVGQSFGVIGKTAKSFNSIIYNAETKTFGEDVIDPTNGQPRTRIKKLKDGSTEIVTVRRKTREFTAFDVDPKTDPEGATVRVFRDK